MRKHNVLTRLGGRRREPGSAQRAMRLTLVGLLVLPQAVAPAVIPVAGGCTLVDAITAANTDSPKNACTAGSGADEIHLTANVTLTLALGDNSTPYGFRGLPVISTDVTIKGYGFTIARDVTTPAPVFGIFAVSTTGMLSLDNTTVSGGDAAVGSGLRNDGGGILNYGTLTLTNSTVSDNVAGGIAGGILNYYYATTTLINSTVSGNTARFGGGIYNIYGTTTLINSTVSGNSALNPTGGGGGGIYQRGQGS